MWRRRAITDDRLGHGTTAVRMPVATSTRSRFGDVISPL